MDFAQIAHELHFGQSSTYLIISRLQIKQSIPFRTAKFLTGNLHQKKTHVHPICLLTSAYRPAK